MTVSAGMVGGEGGCEGVPLTVADRTGVCVITKLAVAVLEETGEPILPVAVAVLMIGPPVSKAAWVTVYVPVQFVDPPAAMVVLSQVTVILSSVTFSEFTVVPLLLEIA